MEPNYLAIHGPTPDFFQHRGVVGILPKSRNLKNWISRFGPEEQHRELRQEVSRLSLDVKQETVQDEAGSVADDPGAVGGNSRLVPAPQVQEEEVRIQR